MNIYDFVVNDISGNPISLEDYKGKTLLVVNTASKCNFTPQYDDLQKLYDKYQARGFEILGFPCNQFNEQDPGSSEEINSFCQRNYGVTFPIFEKIDVNGKLAQPLFKYLKESVPFKGLDISNSTNKILNAILNDKFPEFNAGNAIRWNFTKFLIDNNGDVVKRFESSVEPMEIELDIQRIL